MMFVGVAYATDDATIDLDNFDDVLAEKLNISLFAAQILASTILLCLPLFPAVMLAGYFGGQGAVLVVGPIVGLPMLGFAVALGWLPVWIFILIILFVALLLAKTLPNIFGGS